MRLRKKLNRYERQAENRRKKELAIAGKGLYLFRNKTQGDLDLPKLSQDGLKRVSAGETFKGDDYFMMLVPEMALIVAVLEDPEEKVEKLIVDQPDRVTNEGTIESIVSGKMPKAKKAETKKESQEPKADILLTEDPLEGVEIISD